MGDTLFGLMGRKEHTGVLRDQWACALEAIVAVNEDPEHQHRIKVIIPTFDEDRIVDK